MSNSIFESFKRKKVLVHNPAANRPKEVSQIMDEQIQAGLHEFNRPALGLFLSAFTAGLEVGFSVLLMCTIYTLFGGTVSPSGLKICLALGYPIGFIFVIIGRSELFTEHTALAMLPVLKQEVGIVDLLKLWGIVYIGNLLGGYLFSLLIIKIGPEVGFIEKESFEFLAVHMVQYDGYTIFLSALLAGWMMGLLGWLVTSSQETISRIFVIILVTFIIGVAGLHHCIVGSIEVFSGFLTSEKITFSNYLHFQIWATLGNIIGGAVFVAILKYSHIRNE